MNYSAPVPLWAPYYFYIDGVFSHCGTDAIDLVEVDGQWKIANSSWTVQKAGCIKPPAGHPRTPGNSPIFSEVPAGWKFRPQLLHQRNRARCRCRYRERTRGTAAPGNRRLHKGQEALGREVNPVVMSVSEFRSEVLHRDRFVSRIVKESRIFLKRGWR